VEQGEFAVLAGAHVDDLPLSATVAVTGTIAPVTDDPAPARYRTGDVAHVPDADFAALLGRPVPASTWSGALGVNDALDRMSGAPSVLARLAYRVLALLRDRADRRGEPDLNILFLLNMPFRAISKMTGGMVSADMVDGLVRIVNGRFLSGAGLTLRAFVRNRRANRRTARALRGGA
jgi:beta-glucosidase